MSDAPPLDATTLGVLRLWADAQPDTAKVGISTLRTVLHDCIQTRRTLRDSQRSEEAAWGLLVADLTPDSDPLPDFPKDA